jgi:hypothetical protein
VRKPARTEIEALADREERAKELERDWDILLEELVALVLEKLEGLLKNRKNGFYRALRLKVEAAPEGYWVKRGFCVPEPIS